MPRRTHKTIQDWALYCIQQRVSLRNTTILAAQRASSHMIAQLTHFLLPLLLLLLLIPPVFDRRDRDPTKLYFFRLFYHITFLHPINNDVIKVSSSGSILMSWQERMISTAMTPWPWSKQLYLPFLLSLLCVSFSKTVLHLMFYILQLEWEDHTSLQIFWLRGHPYPQPVGDCSCFKVNVSEFGYDSWF